MSCVWPARRSWEWTGWKGGRLVGGEGVDGELGNGREKREKRDRKRSKVKKFQLSLRVRKRRGFKKVGVSAQV